MLEALGHAFISVFSPTHLAMLIAGVLIGLSLGVIPGIGGVTGMALLLPFTFDMDPVSSFSFLIGMLAVTTTSDTIPSVLFAVPGTVGSQATIIDGHAMAKRGEAGRALGAAFTVSALGGLFGAVVLTLLIPVLRTLILIGADYPPRRRLENYSGGFRISDAILPGYTNWIRMSFPLLWLMKNTDSSPSGNKSSRIFRVDSWSPSITGPVRANCGIMAGAFASFEPPSEA